MAFNNLGMPSIPGWTFRASLLVRGPTGRRGRETIMARSIAWPPNPSRVLWVTKQGKERIWIPVPNGTAGPYCRYHVVIEFQPVDPRRTIDFTIQGGGNV
jgi:hypothetical protein